MEKETKEVVVTPEMIEAAAEVISSTIFYDGNRRSVLALAQEALCAALSLERPQIASRQPPV